MKLDVITVASPGGEPLKMYRLAGDGPGLVVLGGYSRTAPMGKPLGLHLMEYAISRGRSCIAFELTDQGPERAGETYPAQATLTRWKGDVTAMYRHFPAGRHVWLGASLGAWLMLLLHRENPERFGGMLGLGAAFDWDLHMLRPAMSASHFAAGLHGLPLKAGTLAFPQLLLDDLALHRIQGRDWPLQCPLQLLHGADDDVAPLAPVQALIGRELPADRTQLTVIEGADHGLSVLEDDRHVPIVTQALDRLFAQMAAVTMD